MWLTTFLVLLLTLSSILYASREGVLNRFVDVLLSKKAAGVPIWLTPNYFRKKGVKFMDRELLREVQSFHYPIYPYIEFELGRDPLINMPGENIWQGNTGAKQAFTVWSVKKDDPLWRDEIEWRKKGHSETRSMQASVIVNKTLFLRYFDYQAYRSAVQSRVPKALLKLPENTAGDIEQIHTLWLEVQAGFRREMHPFHVHWVDYIYTVDKVVMLFPLDLYQTLNTSHRFPELNFFLEYGSGPGVRVRKLLVLNSPSEQTVENFSKALGGVLSDYRGNQLITFENDSVTNHWIEVLAGQHGIDYQAMESVRGDRFVYGDESLEVPCGKLPNSQLTTAQQIQCRENKDLPVTVPLSTKDSGYERAIAYIPDRTKLFTAIKRLLNVGDKAFSVHPIYQDAINKFGFLSKMIEALKNPVAFLMVFSLTVLIGIQLIILTDHRRTRYGVMLSRGVVWWQIYAILYLQLAFAVAVGVAFSMSIFYGIKLYLSGMILAALREFSESVSVLDLDIIPMKASEFAMLILGLLLILYILAGIVLFLMPLRKRTNPGLLLQG